MPRTLISPPQKRLRNAIGIGNPRMRRRKILRDNIQGITKPTIRRLARRGGVKRIQSDVYDEVRTAIKKRLYEIIKLLFEVACYFNRKTIRTTDVVFALRKLGTPMYGFDQSPAPMPNSGLFG